MLKTLASTLTILIWGYESGYVENCVHVGNWALVSFSQQKDRTMGHCSFQDYPSLGTMVKSSLYFNISSNVKYIFWDALHTLPILQRKK